MTLLGGENGDRDTFRIRSGETIFPNNPPPGLKVLNQRKVDAADYTDEDLTVHLSIAGPEIVVEMAFRDVNVSVLSEGKYQYRSGEISEDPCGMAVSDSRLFGYPVG